MQEGLDHVVSSAVSVDDICPQCKHLGGRCCHTHGWLDSQSIAMIAHAFYIKDSMKLQPTVESVVGCLTDMQPCTAFGCRDGCVYCHGHMESLKMCEGERK